MTQSTNPLVKWNRLSSSRGTQRIALLDSDKAVQTAFPFLQPLLKGARASPKPPCRNHRAHRKPSELPPATHMGAPVLRARKFSCTRWAPRSWLQAWSGKHKTPRDASGHEFKQISQACPKDQLKRGQWENSVPSPILSFLSRQTKKPEKN